MDRHIILASSSPRRRELMANAGIEFSIIVSGCDEAVIDGESPEEMVERLARDKARSIAAQHPNAWVIGADTTVFIDETVLGKPESADDARRMLRMIRGREHQVWGGIAVLCDELGICEVESHVTSVSMAPIDDAVVDWYVASGEPMDKAGSYAIQGLGLQFVDRINGSYSNVVGLDIAALGRTLNRLGALLGRRS